MTSQSSSTDASARFDLEEIFAAERSLEDTCEALIAAANDAGGPDNITAVVINIDVA